MKLYEYKSGFKILYLYCIDKQKWELCQFYAASDYKKFFVYNISIFTQLQLINYYNFLHIRMIYVIVHAHYFY